MALAAFKSKCCPKASTWKIKLALFSDVTSLLQILYCPVVGCCRVWRIKNSLFCYLCIFISYLVDKSYCVKHEMHKTQQCLTRLAMMRKMGSSANSFVSYGSVLHFFKTQGFYNLSLTWINSLFLNNCTSRLWLLYFH